MSVHAPLAELLGDGRRGVDRTRWSGSRSCPRSVAEVVEVLDRTSFTSPASTFCMNCDQLRSWPGCLAAGTAARARGTSRSGRPRAGRSCRTVARLPLSPSVDASIVGTDGKRRVFREPRSAAVVREQPNLITALAPFAVRAAVRGRSRLPSCGQARARRAETVRKCRELGDDHPRRSRRRGRGARPRSRGTFRR